MALLDSERHPFMTTYWQFPSHQTRHCLHMTCLTESETSNFTLKPPFTLLLLYNPNKNNLHPDPTLRKNPIMQCNPSLPLTIVLLAPTHHQPVPSSTTITNSTTLIPTNLQLKHTHPRPLSFKHPLPNPNDHIIHPTPTPSTPLAQSYER